MKDTKDDIIIMLNDGDPQIFIGMMGAAVNLTS